VTAFDALDAERAITIPPGQHDCYGVWTMSVRERAEEQVDRRAPAWLARKLREPQVSVRQRQVLAWRDDVDGVHVHARAAFGGKHGHAS
jgi:hypothetical protein